METLLLLGMAVLILLAAVATIGAQRPHPPQVIYVQTVPVETPRAGCAPLLIAIGIIIVVLLFA